MKIITRFESEWDDALQRYVTAPGSEECFEYQGPVARCDLGGGSTTTTTPNVPEKTDTEKEIDKLTLDRLRRQEGWDEKYAPIVNQYIEDIKADTEARKKLGITPEMRAQQEQEQFERGRRMAETEEELTNLQLETIRRGGKATEEQLAAINEATGAAQKTGEADIERFRTATLRQINEEVASASGLRPTDTPILRLSERAGEEAARQQGMLTSRLAETNAMARLNFPLAQQKLTSDIASVEQALMRSTEQFQAQLQQRAIDNRFRLFAAAPEIGNPTSSLGFGQTLAQERFSRASRTTVTENEPGLSDYGRFAMGVGSLTRSDRRLKCDICRIGELPSGIPVYRFRFIGFDDWHVGVIADEVLPIIPEAVSEDDEGFSLVDYTMLH